MNNNDTQESWSVKNFSDKGNDYMSRFNSWLWNFTNKDKYIYQVGITIAFKTKTENGFPTKKESQQLDEIEDKLYDEMHAKHETIFTGLITGNNMREFVLYTVDSKIMKPALEKILREFNEYVFQINIQEDKKWNVYKTYCPK